VPKTCFLVLASGLDSAVVESHSGSNLAGFAGTRRKPHAALPVAAGRRILHCNSAGPYCTPGIVASVADTAGIESISTSRPLLGHHAENQGYFLDIGPAVRHTLTVWRFRHRRQKARVVGPELSYVSAPWIYYVTSPVCNFLLPPAGEETAV